MRQVWLWAVLTLGCATPSPAVPTSAPAQQASTPNAPLADAPLDYLVWTATPHAPTDAMITVIAIHGMGGAPERFQQFLWDMPEVRVVAPRAPLPRGNGFSWFSDRAMKSTPGALVEQMQANADRLGALIDVVQERFAVEGKVIVTGFSQGGMMSFAMAARHPDKIAGAVPVSGLIPAGTWPDELTEAHKAVPVRAVHGTADRVLPLDVAQRDVRAMRVAGFDVTLEPFEGAGHTVTPQMRARVAEHVRAIAAGTPIRP